MNTLEFIAALTQALVWPIIVIALVLLFEEQIKGLFRRLHKAKFGGTELELMGAVFQKQRTAPGKSDKEAVVSTEVVSTIVDQLQTFTCWYLLKVANKTMTLDEHVSTLKAELQFGLQGSSLEIGDSEAAVYFWSMLAHFDNILFMKACPLTN